MLHLTCKNPNSFVTHYRYFCDRCKRKVDAEKKVVIRQLPKILILPLLRFQYDYKSQQRKKIQTELVFPLEMDMRKYCEHPGKVKDEDGFYNLFSVIIHSGNAYGGHYHAYIRDAAAEGIYFIPAEWNNQENASNHTSRSTASTKSETVKDINTSIQTTENSTSSEGKTLSYYLQTWKSTLNLDKWFDFDDIIVNPIRISDIQEMFGSTSKTNDECAYMLVYRSRGLDVSLKAQTSASPTLSHHLNLSVKQLNDQLSKDREEYKQSLHNIKITVHIPQGLNADGTLDAIFSRIPLKRVITIDGRITVGKLKGIIQENFGGKPFISVTVHSVITFRQV